MAAGLLLLLGLATLYNGAVECGQENAALTSEQVVRLAERWSPLVHLSQDETFLPAAAEDYLQRVRPWHPQLGFSDQLPTGSASREWYLIPRPGIKNATQLVSGSDPATVDVPVYAAAHNCAGTGSVRLSVWLFFPWSEGKKMCAAGDLPIPLPSKLCPTNWSNHTFGSHLADWEHATFLFTNTSSSPSLLLLSAHDRTAVYKFEGGRYVLQAPSRSFPRTINTLPGSQRPVLYAASGSHGLWPQPGRHVYLRALGLSDRCSAGAGWRTWRRVVALTGTASPPWYSYLGRWGPPARRCAVPVPPSPACRLAPGPPAIAARRPDLHEQCVRS